MRRLAPITAAIAALVLGLPATAVQTTVATPSIGPYCQQQWPDSDVMLEYCIQTQRRAAEKIERFAAMTHPGTPDAARLSACSRRWTKDMELRAHCLNTAPQVVQLTE